MEQITYEDPEELNAKTVIYYSHHAKEVKGTVKNKARKFVELDLIEYLECDKVFLVHPIKGYNTRTYTIQKQKVGFECNCQACQTRIKMGSYLPALEEQAACSHILAVYFWLKIKHWRKKHGN